MANLHNQQNENKQAVVTRVNKILCATEYALL